MNWFEAAEGKEYDLILKVSNKQPITDGFFISQYKHKYTLVDNNSIPFFIDYHHP